jgi:hypothetical protein
MADAERGRYSAVPGTARRDGPLSPAAPSPAGENDMGVNPPFTPRPKPQQTWVHSCCSVAKLKRALADPDVSAIEADIMMGGLAHAGIRLGNGESSEEPVMAHPTWRKQLPETIDLTFGDFLERCIADGTRHLKLDFKDAAAVEPCLLQLAAKWPQLHSNGQAIWLNADVLPGPNARGACRVPAQSFLPLCRRLCPQAVLSLGWTVGPLGPEEAYTEADILDMTRLCQVRTSSSLQLYPRPMMPTPPLAAPRARFGWTGLDVLRACAPRSTAQLRAVCGPRCTGECACALQCVAECG